MDRKFRAARIWSNKMIRDYAPLFGGDICNISAWKDSDKQGSYYQDYFVNATSYSVTNYYGERGFDDSQRVLSSDVPNITEYILDLTDPSLPTELYRKFTVVMNHTVMEHIYDNRTAFKNICDMSREVVISIVPWVQEVHIASDSSWLDYWRYSPYAMQQLYNENGYSMVVCEYNDDYDTAVYLFTIGIRKEILKSEKYSAFDEYVISKDNPAGGWIGTKTKRFDSIYTKLIRFGNPIRQLFKTNE